MKIIIVGVGGQGRVVCEVLGYYKNIKIVGFIDPALKEPHEKILNFPVLGDLSIVSKLIKKGVSGFIIGIGDNKLRSKRFNQMRDMGLKPVTAIHPTANIASDVKIGKGTVVSIGTTIARGAIIGDNVIINTGAIVEHDAIIENNVHIGPGTVLAGRVTVRNGAFLGLRSVVKEYLTIGRNVIIGAGAVVLEDIRDNAVAIGVPAKVIKYNKDC